MKRNKAELMRDGALTAKELLEDHGQCPPIVVVFAKNKLYFIIMELANQEEKRLSFLAVRYLIKIKKADCYQSILESWFIFSDSPEGPKVRPSKSEQRKEVICITLADRQQSQVAMLDIERTEAGATVDISDVESQTKDYTIESGMLSDLFDERPLKALSIEDKRRIMAMAKQFETNSGEIQ